MNYIGLYNDSISHLKMYQGLYRDNNCLDYMGISKKLKQNIEKFLKDSSNGLFVEYNSENFKNIFELYELIRNVGWSGDLIIFGDLSNKIFEHCELIGYDICADSMYYSPLGDGFMEKYKDINFFADMCVERFEYYKSNLQSNWLFQSFDVAYEFSQYCNHINQKYIFSIESEFNWRPFSIQKYN